MTCANFSACQLNKTFHHNNYIEAETLRWRSRYTGRKCMVVRLTTRLLCGWQSQKQCAFAMKLLQQLEQGLVFRTLRSLVQLNCQLKGHKGWAHSLRMRKSSPFYVQSRIEKKNIERCLGLHQNYHISLFTSTSSAHSRCHCSWLSQKSHSNVTRKSRVTLRDHIFCLLPTIRQYFFSGARDAMHCNRSHDLRRPKCFCAETFQVCGRQRLVYLFFFVL